jgi:hypothetical protein
VSGTLFAVVVAIVFTCYGLFLCFFNRAFSKVGGASQRRMWGSGVGPAVTPAFTRLIGIVMVLAGVFVFILVATGVM